MRHLTCVIFLFQLTLTINVVFGQDGYVSDAPKLAYWRLENPGKPTVVVIHGSPGVSPIAQALPPVTKAKAGCRLTGGAGLATKKAPQP